MVAFTFILVLGIVDIVGTARIAVTIVCGNIMRLLIIIVIDIIAEKGFVVTVIGVTDIAAGRIIVFNISDYLNLYPQLLQKI